MNSGNSKTSDSHRLLLNLLDKTDLKRSGKYVARSNLSIYYTKKKNKENIQIFRFKTNWKYHFPRGIKNDGSFSDGSYSLSNIQDYFDHILKQDR